MKRTKLDLDPYGAAELPAHAAWLVVGRSLNRLRWHLVQWLLLDPRLEERGLRGRRYHGQRTADVLRAIYRRAAQLSPSDADDLHRATEEAAAWLGSSEFRGWVADALDEAGERAFHEGREFADPVGEQRRAFVREFVEPVVAGLHARILRAAGRDQERWLRLGRLLDEGVCRPDVVDYLDAAPDVALRVDPYTKQFRAWLKSLDQRRGELALRLTTVRRYAASSPVEERRHELLGLAHRDPGDLRPAPFWSAAVSLAWRAFEWGRDPVRQAAGLPAGDGGDAAPVAWTSKQLERRVASLAQRACRAIAADGSAGVELPEGHGLSLRATGKVMNVVPQVANQSAAHAYASVDSIPRRPATIDFTREKLYPLRDAAKFFPPGPAGDQLTPSRMRRWARTGLRGTYLEVIKCGATTCTSAEALQRFFDAVTASARLVRTADQHVAYDVADVEAQLDRIGV